MSAEIIPFDFEEQAVRVILREGEPWFVAADVARVLEITNPRDAVSRLEDDEKDVGSADTLGGRQAMNVINESGLYALIFTSRKEQAKRFRKWVTAEVLPSLRKTGRYEADLAGAPPTPAVQGPEIALRDAELWLSMIREARILAGTGAGKAMWQRSPLPPLDPRATPPGHPSPEDGAACLSHLLASACGTQTVAEVLARARAGDEAAHAALASIGLRAYDEGLFVANGAVQGLFALFQGTLWAHGRWRAALLALPGVTIPLTPRTLARVASRGISLPWALIEGEV